jgi:predicted lipid-binding transport protein (Tim44 family)
VQAFAEGDRGALRQTLTADAFAAFDSAITAREQAGQTQRSEIRAITTTQITDGTLVEENGTWRASLEVRFVSDQVSVLLGRDGLPVTGADAVTELADIWTFERWIGGPKQEAGAAPWRLAVARSA